MKDHWRTTEPTGSQVPLELLDGIKKSYLFPKKCCFGRSPVTFCLFLNSYWKCKMNEVWNSKHGLFSIFDVLLLPVNCNYPNMSELGNTQKWRQPQKTQTGDWTWSPWWLIASKPSETARAGHSTVFLLVIHSVIENFYLIATLHFILEDISEINFSSNSNIFFYVKEHIL